MKYKKGDKFIVEVESIACGYYQLRGGFHTCDAVLDSYERYDESAAYQRGLNDAWETARKIVDSRNFTELSSVFDGGNDETGGYTVRTPYYVIKNYTVAEAIARIRAYEELQKIHVRDEVKRNPSEINMLSRHENYVCLRYADETGNYTLVNRYGNIYTVKRKDIVKTGRHFPEVAALLEKMRGETDESD